MVIQKNNDEVPEGTNFFQNARPVLTFINFLLLMFISLYLLHAINELEGIHEDVVVINNELGFLENDYNNLVKTLNTNNNCYYYQSVTYDDCKQIPMSTTTTNFTTIIVDNAGTGNLYSTICETYKTKCPTKLNRGEVVTGSVQVVI